MITEFDLQEAIAECEGQKNITANTCVKLAAFYTIREHMFGGEPTRYSFANDPVKVKPITVYDSGTEFSDIMKRKTQEDVLPVLDELMTTLNVLNPRLYRSVIQKLEG